MDISKDAIELCNQNVVLNFPEVSNHKGVVADCFDYLKEMPDQYFWVHKRFKTRPPGEASFYD